MHFNLDIVRSCQLCVIYILEHKSHCWQLTFQFHLYIVNYLYCSTECEHYYTKVN